MRAKKNIECNNVTDVGVIDKIGAVKKCNNIMRTLHLMDAINNIEKQQSIDDISVAIEASVKADKYYSMADSMLNATERLLSGANAMDGEGAILLRFILGMFQLEETPEHVEGEVIERDKDWVDVSRLEVGQIVKNYRTLCELLDQPVLQGDSKKYQMRNFQRFFEFEKIKGSQKMLITDIYDIPLEKTDGRRNGNRSIYLKYIEIILLQYLSKQKGCSCSLTDMQMWRMLGMVNEKYNRISTNKLQELDYCITPFMINNFYMKANSRLHNIVTAALHNLENRKIIIVQDQTVIYTSDNKRHLASEEELKNIMEVEKAILNQMNCETMKQIILRFKGKEYYKKVNERLYKKYQWKSVFKQKKLIFNTPDVVAEIPRIELELQKELLNSKVIDALNESNQKLYERQKLKDDGFQLPEYYIKAQAMLAEELLRINRKGHELDLLTDDCSDIDELFAGMME